MLVKRFRKEAYSMNYKLSSNYVHVDTGVCPVCFRKHTDSYNRTRMCYSCSISVFGIPCITIDENFGKRHKANFEAARVVDKRMLMISCIRSQDENKTADTYCAFCDEQTTLKGHSLKYYCACGGSNTTHSWVMYTCDRCACEAKMSHIDMLWRISICGLTDNIDANKSITHMLIRVIIGHTCQLIECHCI